MATKEIKKLCPVCKLNMTPIHKMKSISNMFSSKMRVKYYYCFECGHKEFVGDPLKETPFQPWKP